MTPITKQYAEVNMDTVDALNIKGLPQEKVNYLQRLIEQWRQEVAEVKADGNDLDKDIVFTTHKSKVIGPLTRQEIYEHLS
jgi:hypothetical protein